jgi:hypothetical protein
MCRRTYDVCLYQISYFNSSFAITIKLRSKDNFLHIHRIFILLSAKTHQQQFPIFSKMY